MSAVEVTSLEKLLSLKLSELKKSCKEYELQRSGTKAELAERLHMYHVTAAEQAANTELNEDELLGELDESVDIPPVEEDDTVVVEPEITVSPKVAAKTAKTTKAASEKKNVSILKPAPEVLTEQSLKKPVVQPLAEAEPVAVESDKVEDDASPAAKVAVSKMTEEERKLVRAKRFGISTNGSPDKSADVSQLEKRAARFGEVLAPTLQKSKETEKLQKRLERFGDTAGKSSSISDDDKKRKRLERFQDGASGESKTTSNDEEDRKRRRLERFGGSTEKASTGEDADKLASRAIRFGSESDEAKKAARAKRFGVSA